MLTFSVTGLNSYSVQYGIFCSFFDPAGKHWRSSERRICILISVFLKKIVLFEE